MKIPVQRAAPRLKATVERMYGVRLLAADAKEVSCSVCRMPALKV